MPSPLKIQVDYDNTEFTPGDTISGTVSWLPTQGMTGISLRLFWFTSGRGTQDIEIISELTWPVSATSLTGGDEKFSFTLPNEPYSFSGQLVSLTWAIEAVQQPGETSIQYAFTLTPNGQEITLTPVEHSVTDGKKAKFFPTKR